MNEFGLPAHFGWIEVITGPMFSGKSEELIRRVRRALIADKQVQAFTAELDVRYGGSEVIASHSQREVKAQPLDHIDNLEGLLEPDVEVLIIDEIQFVDGPISEVLNRLADRGIRVITAGLAADYRGRPFGHMGELLAVAEKVDKLTAVCVQCGRQATHTQRLLDGEPAPADGPTVQVGGAESYEARCRECHELS